jgi:AcrR family transcriptional regulator
VTRRGKQVTTRTGAVSASPEFEEPRPSRGPGRPKVLSEDKIVDSAMFIAREQGIARLSMRAVARHLGVPPMTVYGYVPNKDALDTMVIDRILSEVRIPDPGDGPWETRLRVMLCDARRILVERPHLGDGHPATGGSAVELLHRGAFGREATRLADEVFELLSEGDFGPEDRDVCFAALFTYVTGYITSDLTPDGAGDSRAGSEIFAVGLEALIEGLKLTVRVTPPVAGR